LLPGRARTWLRCGCGWGQGEPLLLE
jgi:hypothetical protein